KRGIAPSQLLQHARGENVAGSLACDDADLQAHECRTGNRKRKKGREKGEGRSGSALVSRIFFLLTSPFSPLPDDAPFARGNEFHERLNFRVVARHPFDLSDGLLQPQAGAIQQLVGALDVADLLGAEVAPAQAFAVDPEGFRGHAGTGDVRRQVLVEASVHAAEAVRPDAAELVHLGEAAEDGPVTDVHMALQGGAVGEDHVVADHAVMRDGHEGHAPVVAADGGLAAILAGAAVEGAELADGVAIAEHQPRGLVGVLLVLGCRAQRTELEDAVVAADHRRPFDGHVRTDLGAGADHDVRADHGKGADADILRDLRLRIDDGCGMDSRLAHWNSLAAHISSATVTGLPSTSATPLNFQTPFTVRTSSTLSTSWSPGSTGFLKRALSMPTK